MTADAVVVAGIGLAIAAGVRSAWSP